MVKNLNTLSIVVKLDQVAWDAKSSLLVSLTKPISFSQNS